MKDYLDYSDSLDIERRKHNIGSLFAFTLYTPPAISIVMPAGFIVWE